MPNLPTPTTPYYGGGQVDNPCEVIQVTTAPSSALTQLNLGTLAVDYVGGTIYGLVSKAGNSASWVALGGSGTSGIITLTGNSGGALSGTNINILGSGALAFAGAGTTLTGSITAGSALVATITGNSGGALSPTAGNITIIGSGALAFAGSGSTLTGSITPGATLVSTLTGNTGGAISPTAGNIDIVGAGDISVTGSGSTLVIASSGGGGISTIDGDSGSATGATVKIVGTNNQMSFSGAGDTLTCVLANAVSFPGSATAATTLTATSGDITATKGDVVLAFAGHKLKINAGAGGSIGTSVFPGATAVITVSTAAVRSTSIIFITNQAIGTVPVGGTFWISNIVDGISFDINTGSSTDTSTVGWLIIN